MKSILRQIYHSPRKITKSYLNKKADVNSSPLFVMGNQKSGTSAIGALLGEATQKSVTIDLEGLYEPIQSKLHSEEINFEDFINKNKYDFSKEIIKEPSLTLLYPKIKDYFTVKKNVFILRDPRDNIRSILNRVNLPGNLNNAKEEAPKEWKNINENWMRIVDSRWLGIDGDNYIEWMSYRWLLFLDIYENNMGDFELIRYEDFVKNKKHSIEDLASKLNLDVKQDISSKVDIQYQPKGNRNIDKNEFFGGQNLKLIEQICGDKMREYGYM